MFVLDDDLLYKSAFASLLIIFGVVLLNTITTLETNLNLNNIGNNGWYFGVLILGALMFMVGWVNIADVISIDRNEAEATILYSASLAIMVSAGAMKYMMYTKQIKPSWIALFPAAIFMSSLMALGMLVGGLKVNDIMGIFTGDYKLSEITSNTNHTLGLMVGPLVIGSMMGGLPWQRQNCIADGPGMPMFVIAWGIIVFLNSNRENYISNDDDLIEPETNVKPKKILAFGKKQFDSIFNTIIDRQHVNKISKLDFNAS